MSGVGVPELRAAPPAVVSAAELPLAERVRLIRDGLVNYSGVLVSGIVGIAVVPTMLSHLGAQAYGFWVAVLAVVALIGEVDLGLSTIVTREIAADPNLGREETERIVATAATGYVILALVGGVLVVSLGAAIGGDVKLARDVHGTVPFVFAMGGILSFAGRALAFCIALLYGSRRFGGANLLIASVAVFGGAGTVIILRAGGGLDAVAAWQAGSASAVAAAALVTVVLLQRGRFLRIPRPSWHAVKPELRFGLASQILTGGVNVLWVAAPVLIGLISGSRLVASYDVARKFPLALSTVSWRSSEAFFPTASREGRAGNTARRRDVVDAITRWNLVLISPFAIVLWLLAPNLLDVWLNAPPAHATVILRLLVAAVFVDAFGVGALHVLWAEGRMRTLLIVLAATTLAGMGLTGALLWQVGVVGVAVALVPTMTARSVVLLRTVAREHGVSVQRLLAAAGGGLLLPIGVCTCATFALRELIEPQSWIGLGSVALAGLASYVIAIRLRGARAEEQAVVDSALRRPYLVGGTLYRELRRALRRVGPLRSTWYLVLELVRIVGPRTRPTSSRMDHEFARSDPWDYLQEPEQQRHLTAIRMLDRARVERPFREALEIGCAEGIFTELLAPRCDGLLSVDISSVALARARARLARRHTTTLEQWDLLGGRELGSFDLVVAMDVLDYFVRPRDLRRARARILEMLEPGGHLLVTTTKQSDVFDKAWWRRWIRRGQIINEWFASSPGLRVIETQTTATHNLSLYLRTDG
jgi:O-antigen/teichoic acid export membrane protein/2-polyprenyl-3-methyl-5-hydroxy-6-metoxy-1,4-benzoquinol methylase